MSENVTKPAIGRNLLTFVCRTLAVAFMAAGMIVVGGQPSGACSCATGLAAEQHLREADGVYLAELESIERFGGINRLFTESEDGVAQFRVTRIFSGPFVGLIRVHANLNISASCGIQTIVIGEKWLMLHRGPWSRFPSYSLCAQLNYASTDAIERARTIFGEGKVVAASARNEQGLYPGGATKDPLDPKSFGFGALGGAMLALFLAFAASTKFTHESATRIGGYATQKYSQLRNRHHA